MRVSSIFAHSYLFVKVKTLDEAFKSCYNVDER